MVTHVTQGSAFHQDDIIWVSCAERVWRAARVLSADETSVSVEYAGEDDDVEQAELSLHSKAAPKLLRRNAELLGQGALRFDNLTEVPELHEAAVLHALEVRFAQGCIYTLTGPVLLAVNPFRSLPLYGDDVLRRFAKPTTGAAQPLKPHVFGIAAKALEGIRERYASQTVLISGESGAGKTETTKFVMQFLALTSATSAGNEDVTSSTSSHRTHRAPAKLSLVERQVLGSNPLLEAFGNAQTLRNDNSSRFGKYIELQFAKPTQLGDDVPTPRMVGARIHTYLLEKVRVIRQQEGERGFHIFYQALSGANGDSRSVTTGAEEELEGFKGYTLDSFRYLNKQEMDNEVEQFQATLAAMDAVGLSKTEIRKIFRVLAAVLHLGNVTFQDEGESSKVENGGTSCISCDLLGVSLDSLSTALTSRTLRTPEGLIRSKHKSDKACGCRDALARHLYHAVFNYIVQRSNATIGFQKNLSFCGVLDIFGFEFFQWNSLEQLCINYTNELLQQYFNEFIFENETTLYQEEGISWDVQDFPDNSSILELLHGKLEGVLPMLEEECFHVGGSADAWCNKLVRLYEQHRHFGHDRLKKGSFIIRHFAGPVTYQCTEFLEKNKDELSADLVQCLKDSEDPFVRDLFEQLDRVFGVSGAGASAPEGRKSLGGSSRVLKAQRYSVSGEFRQQLKELLQQIQSTEPHFIRCIKPNPQNQAFLPDSEKPFLHRPSVAEQLSYQGVLAAIKVARAGFPVRFWHSDFLREFRCLAPELSKDLEAIVKQLAQQEDEEKAARAVKSLLKSGAIAAVLTSGWAFGKTRIFLKQEPYESLRRLRAVTRNGAAKRLQSCARGQMARKAYHTMRWGFLRLQARARGLLARNQLRSWLRAKAATQLSALLRTTEALARYGAQRRVAVALQCRMRQKWQRKKYLIQRSQLLQLQRWWRSVQKRRRFGRLQHSVRRLQALCRGALGRRAAGVRKVQRQRLRWALRRLIRTRRKNLALRAFRVKMLEMYHRPPVTSTLQKNKEEMVKEVLFLRQLGEEQTLEIQRLQENNSQWRQQIQHLKQRIFWRVRECFHRQ